MTVNHEYLKTVLRMKDAASKPNILRLPSGRVPCFWHGGARVRIPLAIKTASCTGVSSKPLSSRAGRFLPTYVPISRETGRPAGGGGTRNPPVTPGKRHLQQYALGTLSAALRRERCSPPGRCLESICKVGKPAFRYKSKCGGGKPGQYTDGLPNLS